MNLRSDLTAFALTALCVIGIIVLAIAHVAIPDVLVTVTLVSVGVGGGAALPGRQTPAALPAAPAATPGVGLL